MAEATWATKPERYMSSVGSYCSWRNDLDLLAPPTSHWSLPPPPEDRFVDYYYNILQVRHHVQSRLTSISQ